MKATATSIHQLSLFEKGMEALAQEQIKVERLIKRPTPLFVHDVLTETRTALIEGENQYTKYYACKCGAVSRFEGTRVEDEGCLCDKSSFTDGGNRITAGQSVMVRAVHIYPESEDVICFSFQEQLINVPGVFKAPWASQALQTTLQEVGTLRFQLDGEITQSGLVELTEPIWRIGSAMHKKHPENIESVKSRNYSQYDLNDSTSTYVETSLNYECAYYYKPLPYQPLNQKVRSTVCYLKIDDSITSLKHKVAQRHPYFHLLGKQDNTAPIGYFAQTFQASYALYQRYPQMEQVCKGGFHQMITDWTCSLIQNPIKNFQINRVLKPGKNLTEIMGFDKGLLRILRQEDVNYKLFQTLQKVHTTSPLHAESLRILMDEGSQLNFDIFWRLIREGRAEAVELVMYLRSCWNQQGIPMEEALLLWRDYIEMALEVNVPFKKFPPMLKLAHDVLARDTQKLRDEREQNLFETRAKSLDYLHFEDEETGYGIYVPQTCTDLIVEGRTLHHCVGSYQRRVAEGKTTVVFVRKIAEKDKPLYTMEWNIKKQEIIQLRAKSNANVTDKKALACIKKWREYQADLAALQA